MIQLISTHTTDDGTEQLIVQWMDENDHPHVIVRPVNDQDYQNINKFASGQISETELLDALQTTENIFEKAADVVNAKIEKISNHIGCDGYHIYYDYDLITKTSLDPTLENHLLRLIKEDKGAKDYMSWVNFTERLYGNCDPEIRSQIVSWLMAQNWLTIDTDGRLIGYRGCDSDNDDQPIARHKGFAIVNGEQVNGVIYNLPGSIIELPRSQVQHDPTVGCASGLHVGTFQYAYSWASDDGFICRVAVAPEDIVSVPFECESSKIRCCRFEVLDVTPKADKAQLKERYQPIVTIDLSDYHNSNDDNDDSNLEDICLEYGDDCQSCPYYDECSDEIPF